MSRHTETRRTSQQAFNDRVREYLVSLTDEAEADRLIKRDQTSLEKCRNEHWRPETAGAAVFLGLFYK